LRKAVIKIEDQLAGWLTQNEEGYHFVYDKAYVATPHARPISLTLPLTETPYTSNVLFPFFDGLIPEGWLLEIAEKNWKLNPKDRMGLLLTCCKDCIGAISVEEVIEEVKEEDRP
jgi:serine/threonine-protein kinase HipA